MNKVLICHHLEPIWQSGLQKNGTSLKTMCKQVVTFLKHHDVDCVIITQFEADEDSKHHEDYYRLFKFLDRRGIQLVWHEYGYGWTLDNFVFDDLAAAQAQLDAGEIVTDGYGNRIAQGGTHSEIVLLSDWMLELKNSEILLGGAFMGECLDDMQTAFTALGFDYKLVKELCV